MAKKSKPLVGTWYAIKLIAPGDRTPSFWTGEMWANFTAAALYQGRGSALAEVERVLSMRSDEIRIVPVRCRALTSKSANIKRTR